jgi:hypothetical protein
LYGIYLPIQLLSMIMIVWYLSTYTIAVYDHDCMVSIYLTAIV